MRSVQRSGMPVAQESQLGCFAKGKLPLPFSWFMLKGRQFLIFPAKWHAGMVYVFAPIKGAAELQLLCNYANLQLYLPH